MTSAAVVTASSTPLWYATRASGVIALILLTASVVLGIVVQVRFATERWPRLVTLGVHRNLSLLVLAFLGLHIATAVLDTYVPVGWLSLAIPFVSAYRPLWLGLGTVAFDLLLAVTVTSLLRTRISARLWRLVHWAAYACWPAAVLHGLGTGTDPRQPVVLGITVACVASVLAAVAWRLAVSGPGHATTRLLAGTATGAIVLAGLVWTATGPLRPGWAARAGTPAAVLAKAHGGQAAAASGAAKASDPARLPALPFSTAVTATVTTTPQGSNDTRVAIAGQGSPSVAFTIVISGPTAQDGGVEMSTSSVTFGPAAQPRQYTGTVTALNGGTVQTSVRDASGDTITLTFNLTLAQTSATGTLTAAAA